MKQGKNISAVEVTNISEHGFWLLFNDEEVFLPFEKFPWFKDARVAEITNIQVQGQSNFHWPALDVDLTLKIIRHPENYKLISK